jgi:hypothetical protein
MEATVKSKSLEVPNKEKKMADGVVILGTVAIVGLVGIFAIALVYNRPLWVRGTNKSLDVRTASTANMDGRTSESKTGPAVLE